jgi:hypothetical protein
VHYVRFGVINPYNGVVVRHGIPFANYG